MPNPTLCACGCKIAAYPNQMTEVKVEYHAVKPGEAERVRIGRRFVVRKECEADFKREQNLLAALRALAMELGEVSWWHRWPHALSVWTAKVEYARRLQGVRAARREAWRAVWVTIAPDWLAERLAKRWKGQQAALSAPATPAPALPCAPR